MTKFKSLSAKQLPAFMGIVLALILAVTMVPTSAHANNSLQTQADEASDGYTWTISNDGAGALSISSGTLPSFGPNPSDPDLSNPAPWTVGGNAERVQSVEVGVGVKAGVSLDGMFKDCLNMVAVDLGNLDTATTQIMDNMFDGCSHLNVLDLQGLNTANVTSMTNMFNGCEVLGSVVLSSLDLRKVTHMGYMFDGCSALSTLTFPSNFEIQSIEYVQGMFRNCSSLEYLDLSCFNFAQVRNMKDMFIGCDSLQKVTLGKNFKFDGCTLPSGYWRCSYDGKVYTADEVVANQENIVKIHSGAVVSYEKVESPDQGDNSGSGNNNSGSNNNSGNNNSGSNNNTGNGSTGSMSVYRLYNPNNGDHFYTADAAERDWLSRDIGWKDEGVAWVGPKTGGEVYRMYNPNNGDHFYTTSAPERDWMRTIGWRYEGVAWYSADSNATPLYRLYNPYAKLGCHLWTADKAERDWLVRDIGWVAEDVGWYVLSAK